MTDLLSPQPTEKERVFFENMLVPVNPEYDFDKDPTENEFEYANPVTLNNKLVLYTNACFVLTEKAVVLGRRRERTRLDAKDKERTLRTLRNETLARNPAPPSAAKNLALTDAYVQRCLDLDGRLEEAQVLENEIAGLEDDAEQMKDEVENLRFTITTIRLACENIAIHLSYAKHDYNMHSRNPGAR